MKRLERMAGLRAGGKGKVVSAAEALALVRDGDTIKLDTKGRRLDMKVDAAELAKRKAQWKPKALPARGYARLYSERVTQAEQGCDFDFLTGTS